MLCFEVSVNGERWCRAGIGEFGSMDAAVTWVGVDRGGAEPPTTLSVSGLPHGGRTVHWRDILRRLVPEDTVEIRLVEGEPDPWTPAPTLPAHPGPPDRVEE
jgi:hypothetical protein